MHNKYKPKIMKSTMKGMFLAAALLVTFKGQTAECVALMSGNWSNPAIWSCGSVPSCGDLIVIPAGITVHVNIQVDLDEPACSIPTYIQIMGTLQFVTGNKINLACGSGVEIMPGGQMLPGGGGGSSNWLEICGVLEWRTADGPQYGYKYYGAPIPLAIDFVSFSIANDGNDLHLTWVVGGERGNSHFDIEFSSDGEQWEIMGSVASAGDHFETLTYASQIASFDRSGYIRLTVVNQQGFREILDLKSIEIQKNKVLIYPNPIALGQDLTIEVPSSINDELEVRILNQLGQLVKVYRFSPAVLHSPLKISITDLSTGIHFIQIYSLNLSFPSEMLLIR
jgi:hypothetical protein